MYVWYIKYIFIYTCIWTLLFFVWFLQIISPFTRLCRKHLISFLLACTRTFFLRLLQVFLPWSIYCNIIWFRYSSLFVYRKLNIFRIICFINLICFKIYLICLFLRGTDNLSWAIVNDTSYFRYFSSSPNNKLCISKQKFYKVFFPLLYHFLSPLF